MAIVEMKRIALLALNEDRDKLFKAMQRMGCIEVTQPDEQEKAAYAFKMQNGDMQVTDALSRLSWAIHKLGAYNVQKAPMFGKLPEIDQQCEAQVLSSQNRLMQVANDTEALERAHGELVGKKARLMAAMEQLEPWKSLDVPLGKVVSSKETFQLIGQMPKAACEATMEKWQPYPVCVSRLALEADTAYIWAVGHMSIKDAFVDDIKALGFTPAQFDDVTDTPQTQLEAYQAQAAQCDTDMAQVEQEYKRLSDNLTEMKTLYDILAMQKQRIDAYQLSMSTKTVFMLKGWVPSALAEKVENGLKKISPTCSVEITDPDEGDEPPVALHNHRSVAPFESIVAGFALPSPKGIDPTAVMAPFFACLFGMMLSDAGYGLIMGIGIPLFIKLYQPSKNSQKLMWVLAVGGWFTVLWGFVYNTWFGFNLNYRIVDPLKDSLTVMIISIAFGAIHLFAGLGMAAYMNIKRGKPWDVLYDQVSWAMILIGLGLMLIVPSMSTIGGYVAIIGVVIVVCTAGREKSRNPFKRLISGLGALYGATSWISDLLSYMRLFGMGLATGVIGMVINQLVGMVFSAGIIGKVIGAVLFVGAHTFNAGINILGAYVHSCRLQYIEFFGKFYEEGGRPFKPLSASTRYVNLKQTTEI